VVAIVVQWYGLYRLYIPGSLPVRRSFSSLFGFYDFAIGNALHALRCDADRKSVYYKLGLIYDGIQKHYPALLVLQKGKQIDGGSFQIDSLLIIQNTKLYRI
jgi:hypothetical protein